MANILSIRASQVSIATYYKMKGFTKGNGKKKRGIGLELVVY